MKKAKDQSGTQNAPRAGVIVDDKDRGNALSMPPKPTRKITRGTGAAVTGKFFHKDG